MSKNETRKICVALRTNLHDKCIWKCDMKNNTVSHISNESTTYADKNTYPLGIILNLSLLDAVFDENCTSEMVYNKIAAPIIDDVVRGINGTLFAYGQTSSGKTYTMQGTPENPGMLFLSANDIFNKIANTPERQFIIRVSYIEIYNEILFDLLDPSTSPQIHESTERGVFLESKEIAITEIQQISNTLKLGEANRHIGSTKMNERSSRSHTIFRITIESQLINNNNKLEEENNDNDNDGTVLVGILNLVDLAGSENAKMTEASGGRLKEAGCINKSLSTLSRVISLLASNNKGKNTYINFRDSKLTRLLQPSLNGNTRTAIITCISPSSSNKSESESTIRFACSARNIQTTTHINAVFSQNLKDIETLKLEKEELKHELEESDKLNNELNQMINGYMKNEEIYNNVKIQLKEMNERYFCKKMVSQNNEIESEDNQNNKEEENDENKNEDILEIVKTMENEIINRINEIKEKEKERYNTYINLNDKNKNFQIPINTCSLTQNENMNIENILKYFQNELYNLTEFYFNKFIESESVKRQNESLKMIVVEKEKKIFEYNKNSENNKKIIEEIENKYKEINVKYEELQNINKKNEKEISELKNDNEIKNKRIEELDKKKVTQSMIEQVDIILNENKQLKIKYEELQNINKENEILQQNVLKQLEEKEKEVLELKNDNEIKRIRIEELDKKKLTQEMMDQVDKILNENKQLKISNDSLSKAIDEIKAERKLELKNIKDKVMKEKIMVDLKKELIRYKLKYEKLKKMTECNVSSSSEKENLSSSIINSSFS